MKSNQNAGRLIAKTSVKILVFGTLILTVGWILVPYFIQQQIANKIVISPDINPQLYSAWIQPPIPIYLKVYLFNVTNHEEVEKGKAPKFEEIGPYVFLETRTKLNVTLDDSMDTATYKERINYHFHTDLPGSRQNMSDVVTLINVPYVAAAIKIQNDVPWPLTHIAHMILLNYKEPMFVHKTVDEALFKGWKVPFLEQIENEIGFTLIENNTFAFLRELNTTAQGPYTIKRGLHGDKQNFGKIIKFKNESSLRFWGDKTTNCNQLRGSDGSMFPPNVQKDTILRVFNPEVCTSVYGIYESDTEFEGIQGYKFILPPSLLEDSRISKEGSCYCPSLNSKPDKCMRRGAVDMGPCREGAPVASSFPHFLHADPYYLSKIAGGLKPVREKHESFMDIEPMTGVVLRARKRLQASLILERVSAIPFLRNVTPMLFPIMWGDEGAELDKEHVSQLKYIVDIIKVVLSVFKWGTLLGFVVAAIFFLKRLRSSLQVTDTDYVLASETEEYQIDQQKTSLNPEIKK